MSEVTIYTKAACGACTATKRLFKLHAIPFEEVRMDEAPGVMAFLMEEGFREAPVVMLSSGDAWSGYEPERIQALNE